MRALLLNRSGLRKALATAAVLLAALVVGDRPANSQVPVGIGIDPLEVLNLQIKPNVLVVFDTSGSMTFPVDRDVFSPDNGDFARVGGDDPESRMFKAKSVLSSVMDANRGKVNFGFATYNVRNTDKTLRAFSGTFLYTTFQTTATTWTTASTFFNGGSTQPANNTGTSSANVKSSFGRIPDILPAGCTAGTDCRYYLRSRYLRHNVRYNWDGAGNLVTAGGTAITCPRPPVGLFPRDPNADGDPTTTDLIRPCFQHVSSTGVITTFFYSSVTWNFGVDSCQGAAVLTNVVPCTQDSVDTIKDQHLKLELPIDASCGTTPAGIPCDLTTRTAGQTGVDWDGVNPSGTNANTRQGIIAAGATPIGASLADVFAQRATIFPGGVPGQRNYVIFLTDGDDTCTGVSDANTQAQNLFNVGIETLVIAFSNSVTNVNSIARAGSGNVRDAFTAEDEAALSAALTSALNQVSVTGVFSAAQSVVESVFEYAALGDGSLPDTASATPSVNEALDPGVRYNTFVPTVVQGTFTMPGFAGALKAFQNDSLTPVWDAATKLQTRIAVSGCTTATGCRFDELMGGSGTTDTNIGTSTARIKRRIYTTQSNGVNPTRVALWPPTVGTTSANVAPGATVANTLANAPLGLLDKALGIDTLTFAQLQTQFQACRGSNLPPDCTVAANRTAVARREAREMILAYLAGARFVPDSQGRPRRNGNIAGTNNDFKILFQGRSGVLAESTLASAAIVAPPLESRPAVHLDEYVLFRDGPRNGAVAVNGVDQGFGLRNPDKESPQTAAARNNLALKPRMTVVYYASNAALHAFRGGPCPTPCADTGGEELWAFVPFDQLAKLPLLMGTANQSRETHQYMLGASMRFTDVFVPGTFSQSIGGVTVSGAGKWRTVLVFGRGIGGKHLTAIDVTVPGPFTRAALDSAINPPVVFWNRGNPDTNDGLPFPTGANARNNTFNPANDYAAYLKMGQTWSVPAITRVDPMQNITPRTAAGVEFAAWVGSGYSSVASEGTTFYELDVLTGDVIRSVDVGDRSSGTVFPDNAIVASPAAFIPEQLRAGFVGNAAAGLPTFIYVGDIHGRLWRFAPDFTSGNTCSTGCTLLADVGANQPIAHGVALANLNTDGTTEKPHIYGSTGDDLRVTPAGDTLPLTATPPFKIFGLRDDALSADPSGGDGVAGPVTVLFLTDLPNSPAPGFRGTSQPAAAVNAQGNGRVFFIGTQFTPPAGVAGGCASQFESVFFAVTALTGTAAYDFGNGLAYKRVAGRLGGVSVIESPDEGGRVMVDTGTPAIPPPPPRIGPRDTSGPGAGSNVYTQEVRNGSPVCRQ